MLFLYVFGLPLVCVWYVVGTLLVCCWYVFGMFWVCFWGVHGGPSPGPETRRTKDALRRRIPALTESENSQSRINLLPLYRADLVGHVDFLNWRDLNFKTESLMLFTGCRLQGSHTTRRTLPCAARTLANADTMRSNLRFALARSACIVNKTHSHRGRTQSNQVFSGWPSKASSSSMKAAKRWKASVLAKYRGGMATSSPKVC